MKRVVTAVLGLVLITVTVGAPKRTLEAQKKELAVLKEYLGDARDSLQAEITDRWRQKQRFVEQREIDKEMLSQLRETQERTFTELSQAKEERFARERILEDERKAVEAAKEQWRFTFTAFDEAFDKEIKALPSANPLDMEERRRRLEEIRMELKRESRPEKTLAAITGYYLDHVEENRVARTTKQVVMPDESDPREMRVVRFGDVFAYALDASGEPFVIRQTGKLGSGRYTIEKIGAPELAMSIQEKLPGWVEQTELSGTIPVDVMQNANAGILISGKKVKTSTRIVQWFKSGGLVMFPLVILMLWAIVLVILKLFQYSRKHKNNKNLYDTVASMLARDEKEKAREYAAKHKGVVARVVKACLDHSKWNRSSAEKAVREILVEETPQLHKHLATLAVIAGAAPLLGLLGTVTGMISLFEVITHYGTGDPKILAGGISEALVTTQTGLATAIPILLMHNWLRNQSLHIQSEMEKHAIRILNRLWPETA
jgi:biopolymer transport protein ExbB